METSRALKATLLRAIPGFFTLGMASSSAGFHERDDLL
jgi:hypothetical protein